MTEYITELHTHTAETSNCGVANAKELVDSYISKGYSTVVITDHLSTHTYFKYDYNDLSWEEKIDIFLRGYKTAREYAKNKLNVLLGMEIRFDNDSANDYLVFGIDEYFLRNNGNLIDMDIESFSSLAHKNGLLIYQAHPFRDGLTRADAGLLDGAEVYNGCVRHNSRNPYALKWASENGLKKISGSDFHKTEDVAHGGIITASEIKNNSDLLKILKSENYKLIQEKR